MSHALHHWPSRLWPPREAGPPYNGLASRSAWKEGNTIPPMWSHPTSPLVGPWTTQTSRVPERATPGATAPQMVTPKLAGHPAAVTGSNEKTSRCVPSRHWYCFCIWTGMPWARRPARHARPAVLPGSLERPGGTRRSRTRAACGEAPGANAGGRPYGERRRKGASLADTRDRRRGQLCEASVDWLW
jgi:hypothetical protein